MVREIEISSLDLRYQGCRMRQAAVEGRLLVSIAERGITEPVEGVDIGERHVLLNGFKRWRCANKLGMTVVPYASMGGDEAMGIVALLRASDDRSLNLLEQAGFVDELHRLYQMNLAQIAEVLSRSKAWVSVRLGLLAEMTPLVRQKLFGGAFPVYAYMYSVRPFMRINRARRGDVEEFVVALSDKKLSVRQIGQLAQGYFRGSETFREQIRNGNVALPLGQMRASAGEGCNAFEQVMLRDIEISQKYMQRIIGKSDDLRLSTPVFFAQAQLLLGGILNRAAVFHQTVRQLHDRSGQT
jgi:hypothetical protein